MKSVRSTYMRECIGTSDRCRSYLESQRLLPPPRDEESSVVRSGVSPSTAGAYLESQRLLPCASEQPAASEAGRRGAD